MPAKPELMSPAGDWPQLQTAIEAGADAVYFGLHHFSARAKVGFALHDLPEVMQTLHGRGVLGFVTFNTLVFDHELAQAEAAIAAIEAAGADAVIVQDPGMVQRIRQIAPGLAIHGSTQMSITRAQGAELAKSLGCSRVVLGRELSLSDIRKIRAATDVELEVFVHGALCVSYSGQCFSSEAWGGRSANRGQCAQACRLSYELIVDEEVRDLGPYRYLLSPGDLMALEQIPDLVDIGVACLKIEGRYKDADYVAATTRAYRQAIDRAAQGLPTTPPQEQRLELEQIYSRGLGPHFIAGTNHQNAVDGRAPRHRGILLGDVFSINRQRVVVNSRQPIHRGDGVVFDAANWRSPDEREEGGNVYEVKSLGHDRVELEFGHGEIDFSRIRIGDLVWRTRDPQLNKRLKPLTHTTVPIFTRPVSMQVHATVGQPLKIEMELLEGAQAGLQVQYLGTEPLSAANQRPLDEPLLIDKLGRLGGTPYHLGKLTFMTNDAVFVRTSELNEARRQMVNELFERSSHTPPRRRLGVTAPSSPAAWAPPVSNCVTPARPNQATTLPPTGPTRLHLLVRTPTQLDAALEFGRRMMTVDGESSPAHERRSGSAAPVTLASITLDYLDLYGLRPSVDRIRESGIRPRVASPRILKPTEQNVIRFLVSLECDILVRSGGLLYDLHQLDSSSAKSGQLIGDFSLNTANAAACETYLQYGLSRITPTYDLNSRQIVELAKSVGASFLEVIAYSHLPVFHTEHCVFCRFLSTGTDNTNCGHPCDTHQIAVRDHSGRTHPVLADVGCRNTVFGAEAQTDPVSLSAWLAGGIQDYRLEFVHQSSEQVRQIAEAFHQFFAGQSNANTLASALRQHSPQSITTGSLFVPASDRELVQLE